MQQKKSEFNDLSIAIGTDDFVKVTAPGKHFADKTLLIKEIIDTSDEVTIITRPRRWGKTTNLDMLSKFFAVEVDENYNSAIVSRHKELFQNLLIGQKYPETIDEHQGRYPVIFFTFKNIKSNTYSTMIAKFIYEIKSLYGTYAYLCNSCKLLEVEKKDFEKYLTGNIEEEDINRSLFFLSSLLKKHHGQDVYVFIDEYDALLNATFDTEEYAKTLELMRSILGIVLKDNNNVKKSVVTGITKIAKAGLFFDLNNVEEYSILDDEKYAEYFGFTEAEVQIFLQLANMTDQKIIDGVKDYYNGYTIGKYTLYNPWSIVSFLAKKRFGNYWINTEGSVAGNRKLSSGLLVSTQMQKQVRELINNFYTKSNGTMELVISPEAVLHQIKGYPPAIWTILAYGGYISLSNRYINDDLTETCTARIPNREILGIYKQSISLWFHDVIDIDLDFECQSLNIEDIGEFENIVRKLLLRRQDILGDANGSLFHSFIDGLFLMKGSTHRLSPEKYAGAGRIDSIFYPIKGKSTKIIIHEYKLVDNTETAQINNKIQEALWQVYENYYFEEVVSKYKEFKDTHYQQLEIRGIVAFIDENTKVIGMRSVSVLHDISEITDHILPMFKSLNKNELSKLKSHYRLEEFIDELRKVSSVKTILKRLESSDKVIGDQVIHELGKALGDSTLAERLWSEHGDNLWSMSIQQLRKLKGVGPKRAEKVEKLGSSYKKSL